MGKNKIPGLFRKKYKVKAFNSKILKRIHIKKDKDLINSIFSENSKGEMEIRENISNEILASLKPLAKAVKKNKGMVSRWKSIIVIIIVASLFTFNIIFKDKLLTRGIESGLESLFQADVEIKDLHFSVFKGRLSYKSIIIASSDNNFRNLLETGYSEFGISIKDLAKKRVRIEEMSITDLMWNTSRSGDSLMEDLSANLDKDENNGATEGVFDVLAIKGDDYNSIVEQQKNNLNSIEVINKSNEETKELVEKWELIYTEKEKEIRNLEKDIAALKLLSAKGINSIEEGRALSQDLTEMYTKISTAKNDLSSLQTEYQNDKAVLKSLTDAIDEAVKADYEYIEGFVNLSSGDMGSLASDAVEQYIRNRWNKYYENALKALNMFDKFQNNRVGESRSEKGLTRDSGRVIPFFPYNTPGFLADHIFLSGGDDTSGKFSAEIRTLTNEPDKVQEPLTFLVSLGNSENPIVLDGFLDMRSNIALPFSMNIKSSGNFVTVKDGLSFLDISSLSTIAAFSGVSKTEKDNEAVLTTLDISLTDLDINQKDDNGIISKTLKGTLDNRERIDLKAEVLVDRDGLKEVKVSSDFDTILSDSIGAYLDEITVSMEKELKRSLSDYISPYMDNNGNLQSSVGDLDLKSLNQISSVEDLENKTDSLISEQEAKVSKFTSAVEEKVQEEADKLLDQVTDKIKLPGF